MHTLTRFANTVIIFLSASAATLALFLLHRHGWSPTSVALIGLGGLLCTALFLPPTTKVTTSVALLTVPVSFYAGEALLRALPLAVLTWEEAHDQTRGLAWSRDLIDDRAQQAKEAGRPFDTRDRLQVIEAFEEHGVPAYPPISGQAFVDSADGRLLPLGGISRMTTVFCNELGEYTIYRSDEHGFHNPPGLWSRGPIEIAVIGDSFVHGACVPTGSNFVALIRAQFPRTLNLGMGGIGPLQELATLKEYGSVVRPKVVLWVYYEGNDLEDLSHEQDGFWRAYLTQGPFQNLITKQNIIDVGLIDKIRRLRQEIAHPAQKHVIDSIEGFIKVESVRTRLQMLQTPTSHSTSDETVALFTDVLREARHIVHGWGGRLIFVYLPQHARYTNPEAAGPDRDRVLSLVRQLNVELIDLHPTFAMHPDPLTLFPFRRLGHYTVEGNRLVATTILSRLQSSTRNLTHSNTLSKSTILRFYKIAGHPMQLGDPIHLRDLYPMGILS